MDSRLGECVATTLQVMDNRYNEWKKRNNPDNDLVFPTHEMVKDYLYGMFRNELEKKIEKN